MAESKDYRRGYRAGARCVDPVRAITLADNRREVTMWYVGFNDAAAGEPFGASLKGGE